MRRLTPLRAQFGDQQAVVVWRVRGGLGGGRAVRHGDPIVVPERVPQGAAKVPGEGGG